MGGKPRAPKKDYSSLLGSLNAEKMVGSVIEETMKSAVERQVRDGIEVAAEKVAKKVVSDIMKSGVIESKLEKVIARAVDDLLSSPSDFDELVNEALWDEISAHLKVMKFQAIPGNPKRVRRRRRR